MTDHPHLQTTVLDATDVRGLAEFYRKLLGLQYLPGDEPPADGAPDDDWLVLTDSDGARQLAFQAVPVLPRVTWPDATGVAQQLHLDLTVPDTEALERQRDRALALGAEQLLDRADDPEEPLYVFADPAGHPFCLFVA
ncbi:VOC family protein [Kocuria sp. NPDC057446]|uniref:VOC family protein n=1 Tax=Kocuria sp. NPDC057446 TaxID=3346137 RepID=UPI0036A95AF1